MSCLTLRGMTSLVTRKSSRWKSDTMSRNAVELHWDRYVAKLWKFCRMGVEEKKRRKKKHMMKELYETLWRFWNLRGHPHSVRHELRVGTGWNTGWLERYDDENSSFTCFITWLQTFEDTAMFIYNPKHHMIIYTEFSFQTDLNKKKKKSKALND